ncbi:MAG: NTP transferase domain-containing protein [Gammaproteobacteria bacterium]
MKFLIIAAEKAEGKILAHSLRTAGGKIPKGRMLSAEDIRKIKESGAAQIAAAEIEPGDMREDEAAAAVAAAVCGAHALRDKAAHGRANLRAETDGVLIYDAESLAALNRVCPEITLAALPPFARTEKNGIIGTVKIIPFAVPAQHVRAAADCKNIFSVRPFVSRAVDLIQTKLSAADEKIMDKTAALTARRLAERNNALRGEHRCAHRRDAVAEAIAEAMRAPPDVLLFAGACAVCDEGDEIPAAIASAGGEIERVGMPVDPGNLLVLGKIGNTRCVVLPGCARSPKLNGFDLVLDRLLSGAALSSEEIAKMGAGGLLADIPARPFRRAPAAKPKIGALLLAAGISKRMPGKNKLLMPWRGKPLIFHAAKTLAEARRRGFVQQAVMVCGMDAAKTAAAVKDLNLPAVENARYKTGMASSIICGLDALEAENNLDGVLVMLGDMPLVSAADIRAVAAAFVSAEDGIAVPVCGGKRGNPALFGRRHFAAIRALQGDAGARSLFSQYAAAEAKAGEGALFDVDSESDADGFSAATKQ